MRRVRLGARVAATAAERVDLDFDLGKTPAHKQLDIAGAGRCLPPDGKSAPLQFGCCPIQCLRYGAECFLARSISVNVDHVDINREPGHVAVKKIDGRAALHGEILTPKNEQCDIEQKLHGLEIAFIHGQVLIVPVAWRRT